MPKRLVIIDGYSLLYRAFFATRYMSTSDGRPTNALYGFVGMLFYILEHDEPDALVVALDAPGKTFRHAEYADYKGTRKETADELIIQLKESRELISALGIPALECPGYEADDIVGSVSKLGEENGYKTTIVTGDLDSLQLVDEEVSVMTNKMGVTDVIVYKPEDVIQRYGFEAKYVPDYKAIVGDTSDNIPGVPGIGAKGATALIQEFGTVENMLEHWDEINPKFQAKIQPVRDQLIMSKWLATIQRDAPVEYDFTPFKLTQEQFDAAKAFFELYELRSHARRMPVVLGKYLHGFEPGVSKPAEVKTEALQIQLEPAGGLARLHEFVGDRGYAIYFDNAPPESSSPPRFASSPTSLTEEGGGSGRPAGLGSTIGPGGRSGSRAGSGSPGASPDLFAVLEPKAEKVAYIAIGTEVRQATEAEGMSLFLEKPGQAVGHDLKPLYRQILNDGQQLTQKPQFDSLIAGYVLQSGRANYALRDLVQGYLEVTPPTNSAEMAAALSLLEPAMRDRLGKEGQTPVLDEIELPLIPLLAKMEYHGIEVDPGVLKDFSKQLEIEIAKTQQSIYEQAGEEFNIGSPKQLGEVLFEKMCIPGEKKTKTGYATGAEILQQLAPSHQICADVMSYRELTKLKSTYADSLPKMIGKDGRIHTSFNQTVAATGRLSSNEPNLQNIPNRTELGRNIRRAFVAAKGFKFASFDYSQIELRVLAHMCGDENLIQAFEEDKDVHRTTAALMWGVPESEVSKEQRGFAKTLNFAVLYGVTNYGLANQLGGGFSISEAQALIDQYRERFPKVKAFTDSVIVEARSKGFTTTLSGRRRYFPDIHNANRNERMYAERQAMNAPIQGTASDMIKIAMIAVGARLAGAKSRMLLQVHDELLFELAEGEESVTEPIRCDMEQAMQLSVPVKVDLKVGTNWDEME